MRKIFKTLKLLSAALLLAAGTPPVLGAAAATADTSIICAVPQTYSALEALKEQAPVPFENFFAPENELYQRIVSGSGHCDLLVSSGERLPLQLMRAEKASTLNYSAFLKAPLLLWSADASLFRRGPRPITQKQLKSIASPKATLTPAGYAATQVLKSKDFPTGYLKNHIHYAENEYQVYSVVSSGLIQTGFLTRPVVVSAPGGLKGSFWQVPKKMYPPIYYYVLILDQAKSIPASRSLYEFLKGDAALGVFMQAGFDAP